MPSRRGFSLVELLCVLGAIVLLLVVFIPSIRRLTEWARLTSCRTRLRSVHTGLWAHAVENQQQLPPFAFRSMAEPSLFRAGVWGGCEEEGIQFGRHLGPIRTVNLHILIEEDRCPPEVLHCPGLEAKALRALTALYGKDPFSSYAIRFPDSDDVFRSAPELADRFPLRLGIYAQSAGGQTVRAGSTGGVEVPRIRIDEAYKLAEGKYVVATDPIVTEAFWPVLLGGDASRHRVHVERYTTADGTGAVRDVPWEGPLQKAVQSAINSPGESPHSPAAEAIWQVLGN